MTDQPDIFDRALLRRRKARAAGAMDKHAFLLEHAAADLAGRLSIFQRSFDVGLDLGAHGTVLAELLIQTGKIGRLFRASMVPELCGPPDGASLLCDEEALPLAPASFDLIVSALCLQLVNDLPGTLLQIRTALKPDGLFLAAMLGGRSLEQLRTAFAKAEVETTGGLSPRIAPFADVRELGQLLQRAGFALPVADADVLDVTYVSAFGLMQDLKGMGAGNVLRDRHKVPLRRSTLGAAISIYDREFGQDGRVSATFEIVTLTGWAPHASQQQPLRPGSAKGSLKAALGGGEGQISGVEQASSGSLRRR